MNTVPGIVRVAGEIGVTIIDVYIFLRLMLWILKTEKKENQRLLLITLWGIVFIVLPFLEVDVIVYLLSLKGFKLN